MNCKPYIRAHADELLEDVYQRQPSGTTRKKFGRHCYADLCVDLILCVAKRYLSLIHICCSG